MLVIHEVDQGSNEWLELREGLYTGSNADKLLAYQDQIKFVNGVPSPYAIAEITGFGGTFETKRGHILEDEAIEIYQAITKRSVQRLGFITNTAYPSCGYSPDGVDGDILQPGATLLEVKCFMESKHLAAANQIPLKILAQIHFGLFICNLQQAKLILYNPELEPKQAFKTIMVKSNRNIRNNFKRKLSGTKEASYAANAQAT